MVQCGQKQTREEGVDCSVFLQTSFTDDPYADDINDTADSLLRILSLEMTFS